MEKGATIAKTEFLAFLLKLCDFVGGNQIHGGKKRETFSRRSGQSLRKEAKLRPVTAGREVNLTGMEKRRKRVSTGASRTWPVVSDELYGGPLATWKKRDRHGWICRREKE